MYLCILLTVDKPTITHSCVLCSLVFFVVKNKAYDREEDQYESKPRVSQKLSDVCFSEADGLCGDAVQQGTQQSTL